MQRRSFHALDGLRFVAAVVVVTRHLPDPTLRHWLPGSYLAVDLFFCMSGFVLAHAYQARLMSSAMSFGDFMRVRVVRLWPLYLLGTAIGALLSAFLIYRAGSGAALWQAWAWSLLFSVLMLPTPGWAALGIWCFNFCWPAWSLYWEMLVGSIYALIAPRLSMVGLSIILAVGAGLLALTGFMCGSLDSGAALERFAAGGMRVLWSFFAGVAVYRIWQKGWVPGWRCPFWISAFILIAILAVDPASGRWPFDVVAAILFFPALVLASLGDVPRAFETPLAQLGGVSYALYILHAPLIKWSDNLSTLAGHPMSAAGVWPSLAILCAAIVIAAVVHATFDKAARTWLGAAFASRRFEQPRRLRARLSRHLGA